MPVELNSVDISQNGLHENDFPVNFQECQNISFSKRLIRSAIHNELFACAFLE